MSATQERYINPYTDFGFKKLFGTEMNKDIFYDKLSFVYLEMPKFNKTEEELVTMFDKWMFALRNLSRLLKTLQN